MVDKVRKVSKDQKGQKPIKGKMKGARQMIIGLGSLVKRHRPRRYKAKDAPYAVGGHPGLVIAAYPRPYPKTLQQKRIGDAARACGIKSGISKSALMTAMKDCIPGKFGK